MHGRDFTAEARRRADEETNLNFLCVSAPLR
jgi:hypothetical protein